MRKQKSKVQNSKSKVQGLKSAADPQRVLHELQVHQIELEMQNTELQETRDRMEAQLEKYTDLYDFAPVSYFSIDEQGLILEVNLTGTALLGVERSRLINRRMSLFVVAASRPVFQFFLKRVFAGSGNQDCDLALDKADGTTLWTRFRGTSALSVSDARKWCRVSVADITLLKQADEALRESEARFRVMADAMSQLAWQARPDGFITWYNQRWYDYTGTTPVQMEGWGWQSVHDPKVLPMVLKRWKAAIAAGQPFDMTFPLRSADGGFRQFLTRAVPHKDKRGRVLQWFGTNTDIEDQHRAAEAQRRVEVLAASNQKLEKEIVRRKASEESLKQSERHLSQSLEQARHHQEQLRQLTHRVLHAQEAERKVVSRQLHDEIAQVLVGINVHLQVLPQATTVNPQAFQRKIEHTQRLVEKSVEVVHRFARNLRPTMLDDLGLIPALNTYLKEFIERTKIHIDFTTFPGVEQLDSDRRTVIYRVAQLALTNIGLHARATQVKVSIQKKQNTVHLEIHDNGKSFDVERVLFAKRHKRLGILSMRERVEMVGGSFSITSAPGKGTTVNVQIPFEKSSKRGGGGHV